MFRHKIDRHTPSAVIFHWLLLSFLAGSVNAGGLLACGRFVSHITGFYTLFGQNAAHLTWDAAIGIATIPVYFIGGVMASAYLVDRPVHRGERPNYFLVMGLIFLSLISVVVLGDLGFFGGFGQTHLKTVYVFLAFLCVASGLQNGAITIATGHTVRVTHMTGNTTDLGIGIVRTLTLKKDTHAHADEVRAVRLRMGIISSFAAGSATGALLFLRFQFNGFLLPSAIALYTIIWDTFFNPRRVLIKNSDVE